MFSGELQVASCKLQVEEVEIGVVGEGDKSCKFQVTSCKLAERLIFSVEYEVTFIPFSLLKERMIAQFNLQLAT